jgi:hypothetical protein
LSAQQTGAPVYESPAEPDISESMGIEDYALDRPDRASEAPSPILYRQGWDFAASEAAREALNRKARQ